MTEISLNHSPRRGYVERSCFLLVALSSILTAVLSYRFLLIGFEASFSNGAIITALLENERAFFIAHVVASPVALFLGCLQFYANLRNRYPAFHRWSGRAYVVSILVGGLAAIGLATATYSERPMANSGYIFLALFWIGFALLGVRSAVQRKFSEHRKWMIMAFALTFAGVTFRLHLVIGFWLGFDYGTISTFVAWSCWLPNIAFAIWYLKKHPHIPKSTPSTSPNQLATAQTSLGTEETQ